ncbi:blue-sensitive opsin-like [Rhineura floridana]|uniref:blue-sensitive opsin-like n=1 Tax=Rhineura floridana TaxID=261503 RepID=UPI002AC88F64|nr:blue-sensitive opsin-like [Rhineura floridana]
MGLKSSLPLIPFLNPHQVISPPQVQFRVNLGGAQPLHHLPDERQGITIWDRDLVEGVALQCPVSFLTVIVFFKHREIIISIIQEHLKLNSHHFAVSNLMVVCVGSTTAFYSFSQMYFSLGTVACKIQGFAASLGGLVSLWSLVVVACERYLVICKPLGNFTFRGTHAIIGCIITWVFGLVASVPPLFGWSRYLYKGLQCSCGPDWYTTNNKWNNESYVLFLFSCFGAPLSVIVFSYGRLLLTLRAVAKQQEQSATTQKAEREVTKMVVVMVMGFLVCWLPYASFALWVVMHCGEPFDVHLASIPSVFSKASSVYHPIIYVLMNKQVSMDGKQLKSSWSGQEERVKDIYY